MSADNDGISSALVESVLLKLGLENPPNVDLDGLNLLYSAYSGRIPNDNIRKRIWLKGDRRSTVAGAYSVDFFENWLSHGTGGTCFPANGALCSLLLALGFDAKRLLGGVLMPGLEHDGNHGTVIVTINGVDYLADAQLAAFTVLPLMRGQPTSTGNGIHDIRAEPTAEGFDVLWYPGSNRETPMVMRPDLVAGFVDHRHFVRHYTLSASKDRNRSPFNDALFISRHFEDAIIIVGRGGRIKVCSDNTIEKYEIDPGQRIRVLVEELEISEEMARAIPPDDGDKSS